VNKNLRGLLKHIVNFDEQQLDRITGCFKSKIVKRNELILATGNTCKEFYFVHKGCIRTGFHTKEGREKTRYVMYDCSIGTALTSFISKQPSFEFIDALEDSQLLAISRDDFFKLNDELNEWKLFYQRILEMAYSFQNRKIESLVTTSARQRYENLMKDNPVLVQRLSNKVLASYLDIREETLSRLKSS
jgi:CRP-like cAMP-binding protein